MKKQIRKEINLFLYENVASRLNLLEGLGGTHHIAFRFRHQI